MALNKSYQLPSTASNNGSQEGYKQELPVTAAYKMSKQDLLIRLPITAINSSYQ